MQRRHPQDPLTELSKDLETGQSQLTIAESSYWVRHFCRIAAYKQNLRDPLDWLSTSTALIAGLISVYVFWRPTNQLIDSGAYSEAWRIPFLAGTLGINAMLNIFSIQNFLSFERMLNHSFISQIGLEFEGWSTIKHFSVILNSIIASSPLWALSYSPEESFSFNAIMIPIQLFIYMTLVFMGIEAVIALCNYLYKKTGKNNSDPFQLPAEKIIDELEQRIANLEEVFTFMHCDSGFKNERITAMLNRMRALTPSGGKNEKGTAAELIRLIETEPMLARTHDQPFIYKILTAIISFSLCAITIASGGGFLWDSKKEFSALWAVPAFDWTIAGIGNFALTCVGLKFSHEMAEVVSGMLNNFLKGPLLPYSDQPNCAQRLYRASCRTLPYSMVKHFPSAITSLSILFAFTLLSPAAGLSLQNNVANEFATFMLAQANLWLACVFIGSVVFNYFGCPYLVEAVCGIMILAHANPNNFNAESLLILNTLKHHAKELRLAGSENVTAMTREKYNLPPIIECDQRNQYINQRTNHPTIRRLRQVLGDEPALHEGYSLAEDDDPNMPIRVRDQLHLILRSTPTELDNKARRYSLFSGNKTDEGEYTAPLLSC